jgi:hypothetical protein
VETSRNVIEVFTEQISEVPEWSAKQLGLEFRANYSEVKIGDSYFPADPAKMYRMQIATSKADLADGLPAERGGKKLLKGLRLA